MILEETVIRRTVHLEQVADDIVHKKEWFFTTPVYIELATLEQQILHREYILMTLELLYELL